MERLYKIAYVLEWYLIIVTGISLSFLKYDILTAFMVAFLLFLGPLMLILFPIMMVGHVLILGERFDLIFDKKDTSKIKIYMLDIFCVFGSISIVYIIRIFWIISSF